MFTFENTYSDYQLLLEAMAEKMHTRLRQEWLFFPPEYGNGYTRYIKLPNGFNVAIINCTITTDWLFYHIKSETDKRFTLRFEQITAPGNFNIKIAEEVVERSEQKLAVVYLTTSIADWHYKATAGSKIKGVNILIPIDQLCQLLGIEEMENILPAYLSLKSKSLTMEPMDLNYMELVNEIADENPDTPFPELYLMNRVQLLVERFFSRIKSKVTIADVETNFKPDDIETIMQVEKMMLEDFSRKPPSINELSRKAAMSSTKFKNLFKAVYGTPVYEYYQQKRMQRAAHLLTEEKLSVKETGARIGYMNTSNFTAAFKKQFKMLPQDYAHS